MKKILMILLLACHAHAIAVTDEAKIEKYVEELYKLEPSQHDIVKAIIAYEPEKGLAAEMLTIAWKESNFGKWPINITDGRYGSFGIYHIRLDYALIRNKINTSWGKSRYTEKLLYDFNVSSAECSSILIYWTRYYKSKKGDDLLLHIFASYNGGYKLSKQAYNYGHDALLRYKAIQKWIASKD